MNEAKPKLAAQIQGLTPTLPEVGKIKIGMKGHMITSKGGAKFQPPQKLDHFLITTLERGQDGNFLKDFAVHQQLGEKPTEIPISLLYNDPTLNFQSSRACYVGSSRWCHGDGVNAYRKQKDGSEIVRSCPCERAEPDFNADKHKCKMNGVLSVVLDGMHIVGGVYKYRTTGANSVLGLMSSLMMIHTTTGGVLAGIPLVLSVSPKAAIIPATNKPTTVYVVGIHYKGSLAQLQDVSYQIALQNQSYAKRIEYIEETAKQMIATDDGHLAAGETDQDIADEFYPDEVSEPSTATTDPPAETKQEAETTPEPEPEVKGNAEFNKLFAKHTGPLMEKFLKACSEANEGATVADVMQSACGLPERFIESFEGWKSKQPAEVDPVPEADLNPEQDFIDEWFKKKTSTFSTYVHKNIEKFKNCSAATAMEAVNKWKRFYPDVAPPWVTAPSTESPSNGKYGDQVGPEDRDMGATMTVHSEKVGPPIEDSFVDPPADTVQTQEQRQAGDLMKTPQWLEMNGLKTQQFKLYAEVTHGKTPATLEQVEYVLSEMYRLMDAAGSGMPGA